MVEWALDNGLNVKGHVLVWHVTSPKFLHDLSGDEFSAAVKSHIFSVMKHYKGKIKVWDVVNESLAPDGSLCQNIFFEKMGPSYIAQCFRWAHEADEAATLLYNDNKVEGWGLGEPHSDKADGLFRLLKELVEDGVPVHGVGLQAHFVASGTGVRRPPTPLAVANQIRRIGTLGLTVNLSEFDVRAGTTPLGPGDVDPSDAQTEIFRDILSACFQQDNFTGVHFWGVADTVSWVEDFYGSTDGPLILGDDFAPKPAYYGVIDALASKRNPASLASPCVLPDDFHDKTALVNDPWGRSSWMPPSPKSKKNDPAREEDTQNSTKPDWELT